MFKYLPMGILTILSFTLPAQTLKYDSGISLRNNKLNHFYKMVSWDDSQYKEFNYRSLRSTGSVIEFMNWRAIFPAGYDKNDSKKYPMIVMLHGAGESGRSWEGRFVYAPTDPEYDNNGHNLLHGGREHRDAVNRSPSNERAFPGIVIFPQVSYSGAWESGWKEGALNTNGKMAIKVIEYMISHYNADINRIYLHGLSNGARGTWDIASKRPDLFSAILPMSGLANNTEVMTDIHVTTPVWLFQGEIDTNPTPAGAQKLINLLISKGGDPRYNLYPNTGHSTWYAAYDEPDFFSWMLAQDKREIYVFGDQPLICEGDTIKLGFSAGFIAYQWTLNGSNIAGATSRYLQTTHAGIYTVKFKRNDNQWYESFPLNIELKGASASSPKLINTGSVVLPIDISANNVLDLIAPEGFTEYQWFKNNVKLSTTTGNRKNIASGTGSSTAAGSYSVKVKESSGCISQLSNVIKVVYTSPHVAPAPPTLSTPTAVSATEVSLKWSESPGEEYYEIWRYRKAANGYTTESYKLIGQVTSNVQGYQDNEVSPYAQYNYRIRAIGGNDGKFSYSKSVSVPEDKIAPTAPSNLFVSNSQGYYATLNWDASTDNDQVSAYEVFVGSTPVGSTSNTHYEVADLTPGTTEVIGVRAIDARGNHSSISTISFYVAPSGIAYTYFEASSLSSLAAFNFSSTPAKTGVVENFDISMRNRDDLFVFSFDGYLQIDVSGTYTFYTNSDDGSRLYINNTLVVDNDGLHAPLERSGTYTFNTTGRFPIRVTFFENGGGEVLQVSYDPPGSAAKQSIPNSKLFLIGDVEFSSAAPQEFLTSEPVIRKTSVYPNPFINYIMVDLDQEGYDQINIIDPMNFTVGSYLTNGSNQIKIDLSNLPAGLYYLSVGKSRFRILKKE